MRIGDRTAGALAFGDRIRPESRAVIQGFSERGVRTILLSGDARATTEWVAEAVGAGECRSEVLPEDKRSFVEAFKSRSCSVATVGDGVNDAPALAAADLGIALGSGSDLAMQAAPVVLMGGALTRVTELFDISRRTLRVIRQNLFWAFFYNVTGIALAIAGVLNPILAAAAMVLSSLSVIGNSLRLRGAAPTARG